MNGFNVEKKKSATDYMELTRNKLLYASVILLCMLASSGCSRGKADDIAALPAQPDYGNDDQWYVVDRAAEVDIFYIVSTETADYTVDGRVCHYADTRSDSIRQMIFAEMVGVDNLLSGSFNYFSPYYRQCTLESFVSEKLVNERMPLALSDVRRAFAHYIEHFNHGRPFVLMGFSQGAMVVVDLMKQMDDDVCKRMVAAYVIGFKVTAQDTAASSHIRAAHDSADIGVTVCYNSVLDNECAIPLISDGNVLAINPVNWRLDNSEALLCDFKSDDMLKVSLDTSSLLLHVAGYHRDDYMLPLIGREGNYHKLEISLYADCIRRNIALRAEMFKRNGQQR